VLRWKRATNGAITLHVAGRLFSREPYAIPKVARQADKLSRHLGNGDAHDALRFLLLGCSTNM
jgi:hypothetical protein